MVFLRAELTIDSLLLHRKSGGVCCTVRSGKCEPFGVPPGFLIFVVIFTRATMRHSLRAF